MEGRFTDKAPAFVADLVQPCGPAFSPSTFGVAKPR